MKSASIKNNPKTMTNTKSFNWFDDKAWVRMLQESIKNWLPALPKFIGVILLTFILQLLGVVVAAGLIFMSLGGLAGAENVFANLMVGTVPETNVLVPFMVSLVAWILYAVFVNVLSKVTWLAIIRDQLNGTKTALLKLFFNEGVIRFWAYVWLSLKVFFFIAWPIIALMILFIGWDFLLLFDVVAVNYVNLITPFVVVPLIIAALVYIVWASVRLLFALPMLIHTGESASKAFQMAKGLTAGKYWVSTLLNWGLFVAVLYVANLVLSLASWIDPIAIFPGEALEETVGLVDLLAFFVSLFIFGPITSLFQYLLMLESAKNQSVKI